MRSDEMLHWEDTDSFLEAYRARQEQARSEYGWLGLSDEEMNAPVIREDPYALAAREQLSRSASTEPGGMALQAEAAHRAFEERRREARTLVQLADKLGERVDPEIRRRAETESAHVQVEAILQARVEQRREALVQANVATAAPMPGRRGLLFSDDPHGLAQARERALGSQRQIQAHREMASQGKPTRVRRGLFGGRK
jgi:hypothetical protein